MRWLLVKLITIYQRIFSPDHGWFRHPVGHCRYYPSCSEYAKQAVAKRGVIMGFFLSTWRILRCNPWSRGGIDEVK